jgi:hypothetical protein
MSNSKPDRKQSPGGPTSQSSDDTHKNPETLLHQRIHHVLYPHKPADISDIRLMQLVGRQSPSLNTQYSANPRAENITFLINIGRSDTVDSSRISIPIVEYDGFCRMAVFLHLHDTKTVLIVRAKSAGTSTIVSVLEKSVAEEVLRVGKRLIAVW